MSERIIKKVNHLLPRFIIKYWNNGKVYNKQVNKVHNINKEDYAKRYYYSLGKKDDELENRISKFEAVISKIITKVDNASNYVTLSGKEIHLLKLFCVLSACRHDNTSSVIKEDETGYHIPNNYIFGIYLIKTQEEAILTTSKLMDEIELVMKMSDTTKFYNSDNLIYNISNDNIFTMGQHLAIIRNEKETNLISEVCAIIETTIDSDYLYTYVPISPKTALLLVKTSYYNDLGSYYNKLGEHNDDYLSLVFNYEENVLLHSYNHTIAKIFGREKYLPIIKFKKANVLINTVSEGVFKDLNSIVYNDGTKVLFTNKETLKEAKDNKLLYRKIVYK